MEAISAVLPMALDIPADEEELSEVRQCLSMLLEEDQAAPPEQRREVFELYQELTCRTRRCPVSYRWVWQYITDRRAQQAGAGPAEPRPCEHTWAGTAGSDKAEFVTGLITGAVRDLADLQIEGTMRPRTVSSSGWAGCSVSPAWWHGSASTACSSAVVR